MAVNSGYVMLNSLLERINSSCIYGIKIMPIKEILYRVFPL